MNDDPQAVAQRQQLVKLSFGCAAILSLFAGLTLYVFSDAIGMDAASAQLVAIAFIFVGLADAILLTFWERIFPARPPRD